MIGLKQNPGYEVLMQTLKSFLKVFAAFTGIFLFILFPVPFLVLLLIFAAMGGFTSKY